MRTFELSKLAHRTALRKRMERDPLVAAVLERFPGAEITKIDEFPEHNKEEKHERNK